MNSLLKAFMFVLILSQILNGRAHLEKRDLAKSKRDRGNLNLNYII